MQIISILMGFSLIVCSLVAVKLGYEIKRDFGRYDELQATVVNASCADYKCNLDFEYRWHNTIKFDSFIRSYKSDPPVPMDHISIWVDENGNVVDAPMNHDIISYIFFSSGIGFFLGVVFFVIAFVQCYKSAHPDGYTSLN